MEAEDVPGGVGRPGSLQWGSGQLEWGFGDEAGRSGVAPAPSQRKPWQCLNGGWATVGSGAPSAQNSSLLGGCRPGSA